MIQDIFPHVFDNHFIDEKPGTEGFLLLYNRRDVLVGEDSERKNISLPDIRRFPESVIQKSRYYFQIDEKNYYGIDVSELSDDIKSFIPDGYAFKNISMMRNGKPKDIAFAAVTGMQLAGWYSDHKYCGRCGSNLEHSHKERMLECPKCGLTEYPKLSPAVIIAVSHGDKLLLSKYAGREYTNYALLAGFCEIGETVEETVKREVMEEVGLPVKNIRYYKSQPWSFTDTLLMGFFCELDGEEEDIHIDEDELSFAEWFERKDIPVKAEDCSLTNEMIIRFKDGKEP